MMLHKSWECSIFYQSVLFLHYCARSEMYSRFNRYVTLTLPLRDWDVENSLCFTLFENIFSQFVFTTKLGVLSSEYVIILYFGAQAHITHYLSLSRKSSLNVAFIFYRLALYTHSLSPLADFHTPSCLSPPFCKSIKLNPINNRQKINNFLVCERVFKKHCLGRCNPPFVVLCLT